MKILVMGFAKLKYMPYMNFYLENLNTQNNEVHILYWNRDLQQEDTGRFSEYVLHEFRCYQEDDVSKVSKLKSFWNYRRYAKRLIRREEFDYIFVLHSLPGVLLADLLLKEYTGRFLFDYRDSTYEAFPPFKKIVGMLTEASGATFVSSDGFRRFLPSGCRDKIYTSHNLLLDSLEHRDEKQLRGISSDKIRLAFWGFIRHEELNRVIMEKIAADPRFELHYYGREQQIARNLKQYARELDARNVFFHGEYVPKDRYEFARSTDLIHNLYDDSNTALAMGNKYYDGIIFRIPQLCLPGSFMAECAVKAGVGFAADPRDAGFTQKLFEQYHALDTQAFLHSCDRELDRVLAQYRAGSALVRSISTAPADSN